MSRIGPRHTKPEMIVRKLLHARGWRYRLHAKGLPGTPDLVFPVRRKVVFVNGCFWHGHDCKLGKLPSTRVEFWRDKMEKNRARDAKKICDLAGLGWKSFTVWQCELVDLIATTQKLEDFLSNESQ